MSIGEGNLIKKGSIAPLVIIGVIVLIAFMLLNSYNGLVRLNTQVETNWADIENQLKRRTDLVPDLVEVANKFANNEKEIIDTVVNARAKLAGANTVEEASQADAELSNAISRLLVVVENYPTLKQDGTYIRLMDELAGTENRISIARKLYNESVGEFNTAIKTLPTVFFANSLGYTSKSYYEVADKDLEKPDYNI